jgi:hypothetical protein
MERVIAPANKCPHCGGFRFTDTPLCVTCYGHLPKELRGWAHIVAAIEWLNDHNY